MFSLFNLINSFKKSKNKLLITFLTSDSFSGAWSNRVSKASRSLNFITYFNEYKY